MKIFSETKGKHRKEHGDDVIQLRFKCDKRANEPPNGELENLLSALGLSGNDFLWDLKKRIWEFFEIGAEPVQITKERLSILSRNINNAADVPILRNKEGRRLLEKLELPESSSKRSLEYTLVERVINISSGKSKEKNQEKISKKRAGFEKSKSHQKSSITPAWLKSLLKQIQDLKADCDHQERAHESLVESLFVHLGYEKMREIKHRQGRIDISIHIGGTSIIVAEVKRDWRLTIQNNKAVRQAYNYALECGARFVIVTNGDYYAFFDRQRGLTYSRNFIREFWLTRIEDQSLIFLNKLRKEEMKNSQNNFHQ
jgi:hypothetical protein